MALRKLERWNYARKLLVSIKYQNLLTFKERLILSCQSIPWNEMNNIFTWLSSHYNPFKSNAKLFTRNCTNLRQFYLPVWYEVSAFFDHISHVAFLLLINSLKPKRKCYSWNHSKHSGFLAGWDGFNGNISLKCLLHIVLTKLRDHKFSTFAKFSEKQTFLTPWYAQYASGCKRC